MHTGTPLHWLTLMVMSQCAFTLYWLDLLSIDRLQVCKKTKHLPLPCMHKPAFSLVVSNNMDPAFSCDLMMMITMITFFDGTGGNNATTDFITNA